MSNDDETVQNTTYLLNAPLNETVHTKKNIISPHCYLIDANSTRCINSVKAVTEGG